MRLAIVAAAMVLGTGAADGGELLRAKDGTIREVPDESVEFALKEGYARIPTVKYRAQDGTVRELYDTPEAHAVAADRGYWRMTPAEVEAWESERAQRSLRAMDTATRGGCEPGDALPIAVVLLFAFAMVWAVDRGRKQ